MADPFVAEIRMFGGNFAPTGWALCNGQIIALLQNTALFSLLGTTYGGDGQTTFALPDLQGRSPMHWGQGPGLSSYDLGQQAGEAGHALAPSEIPAHTHTATGSTTGTPSTSPAGRYWGEVPTLGLYRTASDTELSPQALSSPAGTPHNNRQPFLGLTFIIALEGIFPPRP